MKIIKKLISLYLLCFLGNHTYAMNEEGHYQLTIDVGEDKIEKVRFAGVRDEHGLFTTYGIFFQVNVKSGWGNIYGYELRRSYKENKKDLLNLHKNSGSQVVKKESHLMFWSDKEPYLTVNNCEGSSKVLLKEKIGRDILFKYKINFQESKAIIDIWVN